MAATPCCPRQNRWQTCTQGGIHKLATLLRFAVDVVHWTPAFRSTAIVGRVVLWHLGAYVVTVVSNLVIEFAFSRVHLVEPVKSPLDLIHNVGDAVDATRAVSLETVTKYLRMSLIGKHELIDGIGAGCGVLQQVGGIMPSTTHIQMLPFFVGVIFNECIQGVTAVVLEWVESALLLTQVVQQEVGSAVIHPTINGKHWRQGLSHPDAISTDACKVAEVESASRFHILQRSCDPDRCTAIGNLARISIDEFKVLDR